MALWAVYVLFLLSGISGLIYQVVWVREFGAVFGNTVYSAAAVTAVFMCGLGFGGFFVGQGSDRRHRNARWLPLRAYGVFEIGIAILGLAVAFVLPELEELSARFSRYEVGPEGWFELTRSSHLFRYAAAVTLLAPITFLMGGTLTLLISVRGRGRSASHRGAGGCALRHEYGGGGAWRLRDRFPLDPRPRHPGDGAGCDSAQPGRRGRGTGARVARARGCCGRAPPARAVAHDKGPTRLAPGSCCVRLRRFLSRASSPWDSRSCGFDT